jgi:hypothetical protein
MDKNREWWRGVIWLSSWHPWLLPARIETWQ